MPSRPRSAPDRPTARRRVTAQHGERCSPHHASGSNRQADKNLSDKVAVVVQAPEPIPGPILLFPDESHGASNSKAPHGTRFASDTLGDSAMSLMLPLPPLGVSSL